MKEIKSLKPFTCFKCLKTFKRPPLKNIKETRKCPNCSGEAIMLSERFRPPKKSDKKQWEKVKYLVERGFFFQKVYIKEGGIWTRMRYPSTIEEAKEFVVKYKEQAWQFDT